MIGFLIALVAGYVTPQVDDSLARPVAQALAPRLVVAPGEMRLLGFMLLMILAAMLASLVGSGTPVGLILGGTLGYFGPRILAALRGGSGGSRR